MKRNILLWRKRVTSLQFRIKNGRLRVQATKVLFSYLVREMRKENSNDEVIADTIEKIVTMLQATDKSLTIGEPAETDEETDKELEAAVS